MENNKITMTTEQYNALQNTFSYFNETLFANTLPNVMLTFSRHNRALGFFVPNQWTDSDTKKEKLHEISLNPDYLNVRDLKDAYSTLVHEMCHLQQEEDGSAPRRCYHNKDFAAKMERVGLITSNTGVEGGKRTGQNMTHYIEIGGAFEKAFEDLPAEYKLPFTCHGLLNGGTKKIKKASNRVSYTCPCCGSKVSGKAGLRIMCVECDEIMETNE